MGRFGPRPSHSTKSPYPLPYREDLDNSGLFQARYFCTYPMALSQVWAISAAPADEGCTPSPAQCSAGAYRIASSNMA